MKLTVKDVARITGLSIGTVRSYAWRLKLGKREGRSKVFTLEEAKLIDTGKLPPLKIVKVRKKSLKK